MSIVNSIFRQILEDTDGYDSSDQMAVSRQEHEKHEVVVTPEDHDEAIVSITVLSDEIMTLLGGAIHVPSYIGRELLFIETRLTQIKNKLSSMAKDHESELSDKYN